MKISIFGAGNLGLSLATLALCSNTDNIVTVFDKNETLLNDITIGKDVVGDPLIPNKLLNSLNQHRLKLIKFSEFEINCTEIPDIVFICVPSGPAVEDCLYFIMSQYGNYYIPIVICSTMFIGDINKFLMEVKRCELDYSAPDVIYMPVFLRAQSGVRDLEYMQRLVIGVPAEHIEYKKDFSLIIRKISSIFRSIKPDQTFIVRYEDAELIKVLHNAYVALKISFANEVAYLCGTMSSEPDPRKIMEILAADKWAITSNRHMIPGGPFVGPCLTKDTDLLVKELANLSDCSVMDFPLLNSIRESNDVHISRIIDEIYLEGERMIEDGNSGIFDPSRILIVGMAYKNGFNDVRSSLGTQILQEIAHCNFNIKFTDKFVSPDNLLQACRNNQELHDFLKPYQLTENVQPSKFDTYVFINNIPDGLTEELSKLPIKPKIINIQGV